MILSHAYILIQLANCEVLGGLLHASWRTMQPGCFFLYIWYCQDKENSCFREKFGNQDNQRLSFCCVIYGKRIGLDDLRRSLPTPVALWLWPGSEPLNQEKPPSFVLNLQWGKWYFFKHFSVSCLGKASMFLQIFLYFTDCLRYHGPHAEEWLSSSHPPTSASVSFCRLLSFFLTIYRNIHLEAGSESFRSPGSSFVS